MIRGMTGWGRAEGLLSNRDTKIVVEVRTLNHRYFDLSLKIPSLLSQYEMKLRSYIKDRIKRGAVNVSITISEKAEENMVLDMQWAEKYKKIFSQIKETFNTEDRISLDTLIKLPHLIKMESKELKSEVVYRIVKDVLSRALDSTIKMKEKEGKMIAKDITRRVEKILKIITRIEKLAPRRVNLKKKKLKIIFENHNEDDLKKYGDVLFKYIDKYDISEECTRLRHHCKLFLDTIKRKESSGRRLNFITQEMLRETNSISAKAFDATISKRTIMIKEEIEKIREQIQNVE